MLGADRPATQTSEISTSAALRRGNCPKAKLTGGTRFERTRRLLLSSNNWSPTRLRESLEEATRNAHGPGLYDAGLPLKVFEQGLDRFRPRMIRPEETEGHLRNKATEARCVSMPTRIWHVTRNYATARARDTTGNGPARAYPLSGRAVSANSAVNLNRRPPDPGGRTRRRKTA